MLDTQVTEFEGEIGFGKKAIYENYWWTKGSFFWSLKLNKWVPVDGLVA